MPLLDLKTNLKSLKYGQDQPGGGSSGQPYQQVDINTVDIGFNRFRMTKFDDGLVRGGVVGAANASIVDTFRIGKFLTDFPKGPLFIVKQIGLQLSNPKLEFKKLNTDNPTSGQGFLSNVGNLIANTANKIVNAVGPTRIYNLGINTLAQVPVNAFGQHIVRHGLLPRMDDNTKYLAVAEANNQGVNAPNNRLVGLKTRFRLGDMKSSTNPQFYTNAQRRAAGQATSGLFLRVGIITKPKPIGFLNVNGELAIDRYIGGAQSVYGIGNTTILRRAFTEDATKIDVAFKQSKIWAGKSHLDQGPTEIQLIGNNILHPISSNYTGSDFYKSGKELFDGKLLFKSNLNLNIGSESDIQTSLLDGDSRLKDSLASQRINSFLQVSNKQSSRLAENFFLKDFKPIISGSGSLNRQGLYDYNIFNNSTPDVLINNTKKRTTSYTQINNEIRSGSFSGFSNYSGSAFASLKFSSDIKDTPLGLNDIDKLSIYSGSNTWIPIHKDGNQDHSLSLLSDLGKGNESISKYSGVVSDEFSIATGIDKSAIGSVKTYAKLLERIEGNKFRGKVKVDGIDQNVNSFNIYGDTKLKRTGDFSTYNPVSTDIPVYYNGKSVVKINIPWDKVNRENRVGSGLQDQINLTPLFENATGTMGDKVTIGGKPYNIRDLVKFRIQSVNYDNPGLGKWMIFRAYLTQFSDGVNAQWNDIKYAGRGDKFYIYDGFTRSVNIGFKVAALSAQEMQPMYQKLNYLMGNLMGSYENNVLHGALVKMTVGNWFDGQDGILNSLTYTVPQESPWEIAINDTELILPHIVDVQMTFTPIGSQTKGVNKISEKNSETSHIAQNINDIQYATKFSKVG
jgi:hypothetical protein